MLLLVLAAIALCALAICTAILSGGKSPSRRDKLIYFSFVAFSALILAYYSAESYQSLQTGTALFSNTFFL